MANDIDFLELNRLRLPTITPITESSANPANPNALEELLNHLAEESKKLGGKDAEDLLDGITLIKKMDRYEEKSVTALCYYRLGIIAGRMATPFRDLEAVNDGLMKGCLSRFADKKRQSSIQNRNERKAFAIETVQNLAKEIWDAYSPEIRIGRMAEIVFYECSNNPAYSDLSLDLPKNPGLLKPWLRKVAPSEAKKAGRPKKK